MNNTEIIVRSQEELDMIPLDYKGRIYIEFGTKCSPAIVKNKYYYRVVAWGNSSVVARENSSVVARENSSVVAWENSSVVAWENSSVEASANAQIVDRLNGGKIQISGNARIVYMPKTIHEFMDFYGIKHTKKTAIFYKAVHKKDDKYFSDYDNDFVYRIGEVITERCDTNANYDCSYGIHISHLDWALRYGRDWDDVAILEIETYINDVVIPNNTDGKVRTGKCKVLREIPLDECGVYGKILAKRKEFKK